MRLFAIGDLHLSGNPPKKPMEVFGPRWKNHWQRIAEDWKNRVTDDDTVLIAGDTSWAMRLDEAQEDLDQIRALPGKKLIIRGNHDYWWASAGKLNRMDAENNMHYLYGSTAVLDDGTTSAALTAGSAGRHPLPRRTGCQAVPPRTAARRTNAAGGGKTGRRSYDSHAPLSTSLRPYQAQRLYRTLRKIQGATLHLRPSPRHAAWDDVPPPL